MLKNIKETQAKQIKELAAKLKLNGVIVNLAALNSGLKSKESASKCYDSASRKNDATARKKSVAHDVPHDPSTENPEHLPNPLSNKMGQHLVAPNSGFKKKIRSMNINIGVQRDPANLFQSIPENGV